jgi:hypothetical protein
MSEGTKKVRVIERRYKERKSEQWNGTKRERVDEER